MSLTGLSTQPLKFDLNDYGLVQVRAWLSHYFLRLYVLRNEKEAKYDRAENNY